jgi:hypothetical protein
MCIITHWRYGCFTGILLCIIPNGKISIFELKPCKNVISLRELEYEKRFETQLATDFEAVNDDI